MLVVEHMATNDWNEKMRIVDGIDMTAVVAVAAAATAKHTQAFHLVAAESHQLEKAAAAAADDTDKQVNTHLHREMMSMIHAAAVEAVLRDSSLMAKVLAVAAVSSKGILVARMAS